MRDLQKDLETCNKATEGPWEYADSNNGFYLSMPYKSNSGNGYEGPAYVLEERGKLPSGEHDMRFIAESREGWNEAIERAIKAEALNSKMMKVLEEVLETFGTNSSERRRIRTLDEVENVLKEAWEGLEPCDYFGALRDLDRLCSLVRKVREGSE